MRSAWLLCWSGHAALVDTWGRESDGCAAGQVTQLTLGTRCNIRRPYMDSEEDLLQVEALAGLPDSLVVHPCPTHATLQQLSTLLQPGDWIVSTLVLQQLSALTSLKLELWWVGLGQLENERALSLSAAFTALPRLLTLTICSFQEVSVTVLDDLSNGFRQLKRLTYLGGSFPLVGEDRAQAAAPPVPGQTWPETLVAMGALQRLDLRGVFVDRDLFHSLAALPMLTSLHVMASRRRDELSYISLLTRLEVLHIDDETDGVPQPLNNLSQLTRLSELALYSVSLSSVSGALLELTHLQVLQMTSCWQGVEPAAREEVWRHLCKAIKGMTELTCLRLHLPSGPYRPAFEELQRDLPPWCSTTTFY